MDVVGTGGVFPKSVEEHIGWAAVPENSHFGEGKTPKWSQLGDIWSVLKLFLGGCSQGPLAQATKL